MPSEVRTVSQYMSGSLVPTVSPYLPQVGTLPVSQQEPLVPVFAQVYCCTIESRFVQVHVPKKVGIGYIKYLPRDLDIHMSNLLFSHANHMQTTNKVPTNLQAQVS